MNKKESSFLLYKKGKTKSIYHYKDNDHVLIEFRDDTTAFNGKKKEIITHKGKVNNSFNAYIMNILENQGINTHFVQTFSYNKSIMKKLKMFNFECVIRNYASGSICKRLGIKEGQNFSSPIFEFFLKNDTLGDPIINTSHIIYLNLATYDYIKLLKKITFKINKILYNFFDNFEFILVDFKIEFGIYNNQLLLGDEFTPDGCRIWDKKTKEIYDKDRFRKGLSGFIDFYERLSKRIGISL